MSLRNSIKAAGNAQIERICTIEPQSILDGTECEVGLQVGVFFDGTKNNSKIDYPKNSHSNIARLYDVYSEEIKEGRYKIYVPGVGTEFKDIGEEGESTLGSALGVGCEARVLFALLTIINVFYKRVSIGALLLPNEKIKALCEEVKASRTNDKETLDRVGFRSAGGKFGAKSVMHEEVLASLVSDLRQGLDRIKKPVIRECFVDVFGFSRGAAQARVFCSWLDRLLMNGCLANVPLRIRFLGIFDTVASAGGFSTALASPSPRTPEHEGWAAAEYLRGTCKTSRELKFGLAWQA